MMPVRRDIVTRRLVIGNLAQTVTENDIRSLFDACGRIDSVKIHLDSSGRSKGFGFVTFRSSNDAHFAMKKLHMYSLKGKLVNHKI
jgi:polyadenylate-binding protein